MKFGARGTNNPSFRERPAHHAMLLGGMAAITSSMLVLGNLRTAPDIEMRRIEDIKLSLNQVIDPGLHNNDMLKDRLTINDANGSKNLYLAKQDGKVVAVAFDAISEGYAGPIDVIVGISSSGVLLGTRVLSHNETPGLGDKIEEGKSSWITKFKGLALSNPGEDQWKVKKDGGYFDQFTGATITPRAVVRGIKGSLEFFNSHQTEILALNLKNPKQTSTAKNDKQNEPVQIDKKAEKIEAAPIQENSGQINKSGKDAQQATQKGNRNG